MARETPDIWQHANPNLSAMATEFVRGGGRVTADLTTLLTDFLGKEDQLQNSITQVWVISETLFYLLKDISQLGSLTNGWRKLDKDISGKVDKITGKGLSTEDYTTAEKTKLGGIAVGATVNDSDANLKNRANHTGTQLASTISNFAASVLATVLTGLGTPTAAAIAATDTILAAFGKIQSQLNAKLNIGANAAYADLLKGLAIFDSNGALIRDANLTWDGAGVTLTIGQTTVPGNVFIYSNISRIQVQPGIPSGAADFTFNDNQAKAYVFRCTDGKEYLAFRSTDGDEAVILLQKWLFDMGIFAPLSNLQAQVSTIDGTKTYLLDNAGNMVRIPFAVDNVTINLSGIIRGYNNSGSIGNNVLSAKFDAIFKRISGTISLVGTIHLTRLTDFGDTNNSGTATSFTVGAEAGADTLGNVNSAILLYVTSNTTTTMDWKLGKLEYF